MGTPYVIKRSHKIEGEGPRFRIPGTILNSMPSLSLRDLN